MLCPVTPLTRKLVMKPGFCFYYPASVSSAGLTAPREISRPFLFYTGPSATIFPTSAKWSTTSCPHFTVVRSFDFDVIDKPSDAMTSSIKSVRI